MKTKLNLIATLLVAALCLATSCTPKEPITPDTEKIKIHVSQEAASTTGVTLSWTDEKGDNKNYTIKVYTDSACTNLYQEYSLVYGINEAKKFSVPYLDCVNTYYIRIENITGYKSDPFEVSLSQNFIRRKVVTQDFDQLHWGYDYIHGAHGVVLNPENKPSSYLVDELVDARHDSQPTTSIDDNGGLLFKYRAAMIEKMGFKGWSGSEVRILPGYVKIGSAYNVGSLVTPTFSVLESSTDKVDISFNACIFASTLSASGGKITALVIKGDGTTLATKDFNMNSLNGFAEWKSYKFSVEGATADCHLEIRTSEQVKSICIDNLKVVRHLSIPEGYIYGYTYDKATGTPIEGVAVSDGFSVMATDKDGMFMMKPHIDSWYVYYSIPADCKVLINAGSPRFFAHRTKDVSEYNFALERMPEGKENKFALFTFADPQVSSSAGLKRFQNEAAPGIKSHASTLTVPCYGITLGDIVSTSDNKNTIGYMETMRDAMRLGYMGMPVFQVMGNHDSAHFTTESPLEPDENSSNFEVKAQRAFETTFCPINYSFNRGDVHIVGMRDIVYNYNTTSGDYSTGFLKEQYEWLKQDLALVPKSKMVVLCVHIPLFGNASSSGESGHYVKEVHKLLNEFDEAHVISGHTHIQRNYEHTSYKIYEHNMGTVCGTWWCSNLCGCGAPNGYGVFMGEGNTFSEWYYMGYNEGMNTRDYQLRLYRGNAITGAEKQDNQNGYEGYYAFNMSDDIILANVFNADSKWKIEVYENGEYSGNMTLMKASIPSFSKLVGSYTFDDPRRIADGTESSKDMWVSGIHLGVLDRYDKSKKSPSNGSWTNCYHMYKYKLKNKDSQVKVVATDRFGNKYESTKFVDYRDNKLGLKP